MDTMPCGQRVCKRCLIANTMKICPECHGYCHSNSKLCACGHEFNIKAREPRKTSVKPEIPAKLCDVLLTVRARRRAAVWIVIFLSCPWPTNTFSTFFPHPQLRNIFKPTHPDIHDGGANLPGGFALYVYTPRSESRSFIAEGFSSGLHNATGCLDVSELSKSEINAAVRSWSAPFPGDVSTPDAANIFLNSLNNASRSLSTLKRRLCMLIAKTAAGGESRAVWRTGAPPC